MKKQRDPRRQVVRKTGSRLAALAVGLALGCSKAPNTQGAPSAETPAPAPAAASERRAPASPPLARLGPFKNLVFLTVDALRADQPWTGYDGVETPHLSRLAQRCAVYTRAYALANFTTASLNGMLASRYPSELTRSACHLGSYDIPNSLTPQLASAGIRTFAAHGHAIFAGDSAPRTGFADWRVIKGAAGRMQTDGATTADAIAALFSTYLEEQRAPGRLFAWIHLLDPHHIYVPHAEFPPRGSSPRAIYDSEVAFTDAAIGQVLKDIERAGMADDTAVVVTADHGEAFGEHGFVYHGQSLYEEEIRVPLLVCLPGGKGMRIDEPRSAIDIAPTLADLLGVKPHPSWLGRSLLADLNATPQPRRVLVDAPPAGPPPGAPARQAMIAGNRKVILVGGSAQVFDLAADPAEKQPLDGSTAAVAEARKELASIKSVPGAPCAPSNRNANE